MFVYKLIHFIKLISRLRGRRAQVGRLIVKYDCWHVFGLAIGRGHTDRLWTLVFPAFSKLAAKRPFFFTIKRSPLATLHGCHFALLSFAFSWTLVDFFPRPVTLPSTHAQISWNSHLFYLIFVQVYSPSPSCQARWRKYAKPPTKTFWVSPNSPNTVLSRPRVANTRPVTIWEGKLTENNSHLNMWIVLVILLQSQISIEFQQFVF